MQIEIPPCSQRFSPQSQRKTQCSNDTALQTTADNSSQIKQKEGSKKMFWKEVSCTSLTFNFSLCVYPISVGFQYIVFFANSHVLRWSSFGGIQANFPTSAPPPNHSPSAKDMLMSFNTWCKTSSILSHYLWMCKDEVIATV